jgi:hypothetical protein
MRACAPRPCQRRLPRSRQDADWTRQTLAAEAHSKRFWERWQATLVFLRGANLVKDVVLASTFAPFDAPNAVEETLRCGLLRFARMRA